MKKRRKSKPEAGRKRITRAIPHIRLKEANPGKIEILDRTASAFLALCQAYVTAFCTGREPNAFADPFVQTELSERWQRVAIQQAAGIASAFRTNRANAYTSYEKALASYREAQEAGTLSAKRKEPTWEEWDIPTLRLPSIQANANVVTLEPSESSSFDFWLCISTIEKGNPIRIPVNFADYHFKALGDHLPNTSVLLARKKSGWWLQISVDEEVPYEKPDHTTEVVGVDVGIASFLTTSTGKSYGTFGDSLKKRHQRDREKRRRKAKLRACLKKKGAAKLPSTSSTTGQRLARCVRHSINRAINEFLADHQEAQIAYEDLSVASMRFKSRQQNAYLYASNLGHIPKQLAWACLKRGIWAETVNPAYSSQECHHCHYVDRKNRPDQKTFKCVACSHANHADNNAALNLAFRLQDAELRACKKKEEVKALLLRRHEQWQQENSLPVVQAPVQLGLFEASTDLG